MPRHGVILADTTDPVMMEVLAAARSEAREPDLRRMLLRSGLLAVDAVTTSMRPRGCIARVAGQASPRAAWSTA